MGSTLSSVPNPAPVPVKLAISPEEIAHLNRMFGNPRTDSRIMPTRYLPVTGLPQFVHESSVGGEFMHFSLRGSDEKLFKAYYESFLKTWGDYVVFRDEPSCLRDGEWCIVGFTSCQVMEAWTGKPSF